MLWVTWFLCYVWILMCEIVETVASGGWKWLSDSCLKSRINFPKRLGHLTPYPTWYFQPIRSTYFRKILTFKSKDFETWPRNQSRDLDQGFETFGPPGIDVKIIFNRYRRKGPKVDASVFDSALSHTRRSDASKKKKKIAWWRCVHFWTFSPVDKFRVLACIG